MLEGTNGSTSAPGASSRTAYVLAGVFLALALLIIIAIFRATESCAQHLESARYNQENYGSAPSTCFQYFLNKAVQPALGMSLPFFFLAGVLLTKEKRRERQSGKPKQEKIAFALSISTVLTFLLSLILIRSIRCEGFGCLGLAPLIALVLSVFPPLLFVFALWYLQARYPWNNRHFLAVAVTLALLTLLAYAQTPLL